MLLSLTAAVALAACSSGDVDRPGDAALPRTSLTSPADEAVEAGLAKHVAGDLEGAAASYDDALAREPGNVAARYNLGLIAQTLRHDGRAEQRYREVLQIDPDYQPALFNLAIIRRAAADPQEAEALYRRAVALQPRDASARLNLGLLLREEGRPDEGDAEIATALELNPELVDPAAG